MVYLAIHLSYNRNIDPMGFRGGSSTRHDRPVESSVDG